MPATPRADPLLRLIALFKLAKSLLFLCAGVGLLQFLHRDVQARLILFMDNVHVDPENHVAQWALKGAATIPSLHFLHLQGVALLSAAAFFYAILFGVEGTGLYLQKRWGEWMVVIITGSLLPVEIYEIVHRVTALKVLFMIGNLIIVGYLIYTIIGRKNDHPA